jgi:two-component system LytT family response regulator
MEKIRSIIIDDEFKSIWLLKRLLTIHCPQIEVVAEASRMEEAIMLIETHHPQLIFLDVEMPGGSGFDLLEKITKRNFHVIFISAHSDFAIKAFQFSVTDYLLKPINRDLLINSILKVESITSKYASYNFHKTIRVPTNKGVLFIPMGSIVRLAADGSYTKIYIEKGVEYLCSSNLRNFEGKLDLNIFIRINRSNIINKEKITSIVDKQHLVIEMADGEIIDVPRRSKKEIMELLGINL